MATGAFVRVERDGSWQAIEIDCLSDGELDQLAESQKDGGWRWAKFLAKWIRDNVGVDATRPPEKSE